ncbi:uncharacterized protein LOC134197434 [Corticium candelabrum]|uniref:uncharacterized protein LOC134197434 n=1 Tax=Corticium candelabrum TaxID=121492 RepID=UPI002E2613FD|nr:uncharacterized protein LOC134197434 [Corticium candelabrum]
MRNMRARFTAREWIFLTLGIANITVLVILAYFGCNLDGHRPHSSSEVLVALELEPNFTPKWFAQECVGAVTVGFSVENLFDMVATWCNVRRSQRCRQLCEKFNGIYSLSKREGQVVLPDTFVPKVRKWLGGNEELLKQVNRQSVTSVFNIYTHEGTLFSPLRAKRPGSGDFSPDVDKYIDELNRNSEKDCDFCNYKTMTAQSVFPRVESKLTASASNAFIYDGFHGLLFPRSHHPVKFSEEEVVDMMQTTIKWFKAGYNVDRSFKYPHMMWDILPKASASQPHPHVQVSLSPDHHYGQMEHLRISANQYAADHNRNYFTDVIELHHALGLTVKVGQAVAIAYLTPRKTNEVIVLSKTATDDFFRLIFYVIQALFDQKIYAISSATVFPALHHFENPPANDLPAMSRIISRGGATSPRGDISAMELFGASNVFSDPWNVIANVQKSVYKRATRS